MRCWSREIIRVRDEISVWSAASRKSKRELGGEIGEDGEKN